MPALSKTGLVPSVPKKICYAVQSKTTLDISSITMPAPYVLRPFAGIYNPFPYACSVLCNHPADLEAKNVVKRAKDTWAIEGRALLSSDDLKVIKCQKFHKNHEPRFLADAGVTVPEELFRRYTDTDSRPLTPAPTVISLTTKHSQFFKRRRCMTPDPVSSFPNQERTLLVLDLRRSHSQETITWLGSQQGDSVSKLQTTATSRTSSVSRTTTVSSKKKKPLKNPSITPRSARLEDKTSRIQSSKSSLDSKLLLVLEQPSENKTQAVSSSGSEPEVVKRRGKKKKGKKSGGKDGEKEFQGFPEPGETQVSALNDDSRMGSTRPSITTVTGHGDSAEAALVTTVEDASKQRSGTKSFLDTAILKQLQRQLDHEAVESEMNVKRKIALEEALRLAKKVKSKANQEIKTLKKELCLIASNPEKWLSLPRVFTRQSARFELPMDSRTLNDLTPLQYAERYVFPSEERLVLYNHIFNLHMEEFDEDEDEKVERTLLGKNVARCLSDVMGRRMTAEEARDFQSLIGWTDSMTIDFRTFVGIGAICERLLARKFCSNMPTPSEDLKHEVERADFESLERKLQYVKPDKRMVTILTGIRDL